MNTQPMAVSHTSTDVTITIPADLARVLADVWAEAHALDPERCAARPDWHRDVISLMSHAAMSDQAAGGGPVPVEALLLSVPAMAERPALKAVQP